MLLILIKNIISINEDVNSERSNKLKVISTLFGLDGWIKVEENQSFKEEYIHMDRNHIMENVNKSLGIEFSLFTITIL